MAQKSKSLSIFLIVLLSIAGLTVIGFFALAITRPLPSFGFHFNSSNSNYYNNLVASETYDATVFNTLHINQKYGDIEINSVPATEDAKISVSAYAKESRYVEFADSDSTINLESKTPDCHFLCFNQNGVKFVVSVPENYAGTFNLYNDYGETKIGNFKEAIIIAESDYGNIEVGEAKVAKLTLDAGNAKVGACYGKIEIENDMGNVEIDYLDLKENSSIVLDMGNVEIHSVGNVRVISKVDLGNSDVQNSSSDAPVVLTIENDMGNVTVR